MMIAKIALLIAIPQPKPSRTCSSAGAGLRRLRRHATNARAQKPITARIASVIERFSGMRFPFFLVSMTQSISNEKKQSNRIWLSTFFEHNPSATLSRWGFAYVTPEDLQPQVECRRGAGSAEPFCGRSMALFRAGSQRLGGCGFRSDQSRNRHGHHHLYLHKR